MSRRNSEAIFVTFSDSAEFFFRDFWPDQNALNVILLFEERNALRVSFFCQWLFSVYCSEYSNSGTGLKECAVTSVFRKD